MSTTTTTVAIDHTAYPYIMDKIITHSGVNALLALRGTSKAFQARCNRLLFHHVVIDLCDEDKRSPTPLEHGDPIDERVATAVTSRSRPGGGTLPPLYGKVRILDHVTEHRPPQPVARRFTQLHALRRTNRAWALPGPSILYPSDSVIAYIDMRTDDVHRYDSLNVVKIPLKTERAIMHFRYDPADRSQTHFPISVNNEFVMVHNFTFVLWPTTTSDAPPKFVGAAIRSALAKDRLHPLLSVTIVLPQALGSADMDAWFASIVRPDDDNYYHLEEAEIRPATRFLTIDEWWAELGETKNVEGVWPTALA